MIIKQDKEKRKKKEQEKNWKKQEKNKKGNYKDFGEQEKEMKSQKLVAKAIKRKNRLQQQGIITKDDSINPKKKRKTNSGGSVFEDEIKTSNFKQSRDRIKNSEREAKLKGKAKGKGKNQKANLNQRDSKDIKSTGRRSMIQTHGYSSNRLTGIGYFFFVELRILKEM